MIDMLPRFTVLSSVLSCNFLTLVWSSLSLSKLLQAMAGEVALSKYPIIVSVTLMESQYMTLLLP